MMGSHGNRQIFRWMVLCLVGCCLAAGSLSAQTRASGEIAMDKDASTDVRASADVESEDVILLQKIIKAMWQKNEKELKRLERKYAGEVQEADERTQERLASKFQLSGSLSCKYLLRADDQESDHDLRNTLHLEMRHIVPDALHFNMQAALISDFAGDQYRRTLPSATLRDVYDGYDTPVQGRLYQAYFTLENVISSESRVRLGRQEYYLDRAYYFDGVSAEIRLHPDVQVVALGGVANYADKGPKVEDWLLGCGLEISPWSGGELSFHYLHLDENAKSEGLNDDVYLLKARQKLSEYVRLDGYFSAFAEKTGEVDVKVDFVYPDWDLQLQLAGHVLINRLYKMTTGFDTYTGFMTTEQPYQQLDVNIGKGIGKSWHVQAGYSGRRLDNDRDYGPFNREYSRFYATVSASDWPQSKLSASLSGEAWLADGGNTFYGVDAELSYRASDYFKASAGVDYALYKYGYYYQDEKTDVYTLFAKLRYKISHYVETKGKYECELCDSEATHVVELEALIAF